MWSDPIDNALGQLQMVLDFIASGKDPTSDWITRAQKATTRAREVRAWEQDHQRLVTPEDRF